MFDSTIDIYFLVKKIMIKISAALQTGLFACESIINNDKTIFFLYSMYQTIECYTYFILMNIEIETTWYFAIIIEYKLILQ